MSKRILISILLLTFLLFSGCVSQQVITGNSVTLPGWINSPPENDGEYYYFGGMKTNANTLESGFAGAEANAAGKLMKMLQARITEDYDRLRSEIELPNDAEVRDTGSYVRNQVSKYSYEFDAGANTINKHREVIQLNLWGRTGFNCYVLVRYSRDEYHRLKSKVIGVDPAVLTGLEYLGRKSCEECLDYFSAVAGKRKRDEQAQYYLALANDRCDRKVEAYHAYKAFVAMSPESGLLRKRAEARIRDLGEGVIEQLIGGADTLAGRGEFKKALEKLEGAYALMPSGAVSDKIVDMYTRYAIRNIVQKLARNTGSLKEKTVAVADIEDLTEEFCDALTNLTDLKVVERVLLPDLLKEMEIAQTGIVSEESQKELGNIVNAETMVAGSVGNVGSSFKIYAKLVLVEKGVIVASESADLLGFDIPDTAGDASFHISVRTDRDSYRLGDRARIYLTANRDCYVTVLNMRSNGEITRLFPNKYDKENFIRANIEHSVPEKGSRYELAISEPPGRESIKVIATSRPVSLGEINTAISADTNVLTRSMHGNLQEQDTFFREISSAEMRGWHNVLRGMGERGMEPRLKEGAVYKDDNPYINNSGFEYAVSSSLFETRR
jgi:TolB-like protein